MNGAVRCRSRSFFSVSLHTVLVPFVDTLSGDE